jgi:hypothetical protein
VQVRPALPVAGLQHTWIRGHLPAARKIVARSLKALRRKAFWSGVRLARALLLSRKE